MINVVCHYFLSNLLSFLAAKHAGARVPVQPERESGRSALVLDAALRAGIFKALGSFDPMGFWDGHGS